MSGLGGGERGDGKDEQKEEEEGGDPAVRK